MNKKHRIIALRRAQGLSQLELAEKAGTSQQALSRVEKGLTQLNEKWAQRLATALGVSQAALMENAMEPDREELMDLYDALSDSQREAVLNLARTMVPPASETD